ncbi:helix-turn-helix transcriptional regulator [Dyella koreensis]|uniref:Transcriptional regulator n=1 Tax=Dyella koreensis TaxID=311235 RepID=A0ABW8K4X0_9GAMM
MRALLVEHAGCTVETLCMKLRITHNAVRQHLSALIAHGYVERAQSRPSGGRPLATFRMTEQGRSLFPRNYGVIATEMFAALRSRLGDEQLDQFMQQMGLSLGQREVPLPATATQEEVVRVLASHLDGLGYEALPVKYRDEWQIEAFNCVFHALASQHKEVCKFDVAYMKAASGRNVHHMECIVRGGQCCRFRVDAAAAKSDGDADS